MNKKILTYKNIILNINLILDTTSPITNIEKMSIIANELYSEFNYWTFCGFYIVSNGILVIGPYNGNIIPCTHISIGNGVCGISAKEKKTIIVDDVSKFQNYISCDSNTKSEIVIPIYDKEELIAVLDIDSPNLRDFNKIDKEYLERISILI